MKFQQKLKENLEVLFKRYISAFENYDLTLVKACYHLPCSLHTPDKIAYLNSESVFAQEFKDIFIVLQHAKTKKIVATKASYNQSSHSAIDVCIDWSFIDRSDEVFAEFTAFYQLAIIDNQIKIISVVSHELSNSIVLSQMLDI